tara:strand:- start:160 stop:843 length:684 start_codon:yes stop_codon:yes gene_type:complete
MEGLPQELQFELKDENELLHNMEKNSEEPAIDMEIIEEPEEVPDVVELDVPEIKKEPIKTEDIFLTPEVPKPPEPVKPVKLNKNGQPRKKRVYTEEQKNAMRERMKLARQQRGKNTEAKKQKKANEKKHKELKEKTMEQEIEEMEQKLNKKNNPQPAPEPKQSFTKQDLEDAQLNAIVEYEKIRKQRKQKKKQEQLIAQEKEALKNLVKREMNQSWEATAGRFSSCY